MNILKCISVVMSVFGFALGLIAAYYWLKASKIIIKPGWELKIEDNVNKNMMGWVTGVMTTFKKASDLNARAAWLTAAAVILSQAGNLLYTLSI